MPRKFANSSVQFGALWRKIIIGQLNRFRAGVVIKSTADLVYSVDCRCFALGQASGFGDTLLLFSKHI